MILFPLVHTGSAGCYLRLSSRRSCRHTSTSLSAQRGCYAVSKDVHDINKITLFYLFANVLVIFAASGIAYGIAFGIVHV